MRLALPFVLTILFAAAAPARADTLRLALLTTEMERDGPGLLLRDIRTGEDPQIEAAAKVIAGVDPDVLVLLRFDYDLDGLALTAFADRIAQAGTAPYPHRFARAPNTGRSTGLDMDGDGRRGGPRDAQGYGTFAGQGGMAVLSRAPVDRDAVRDFSAFLWSDLPGARQPEVDGTPFPSPEALAVQRLAGVGAWEVPVRPAGAAPLRLLVSHASPPVFDGPEDRNGLRNRDELRFWALHLNGDLPWPAPVSPVVVMANLNQDPTLGEGHKSALHALRTHPRLQDPMPTAPPTADWPPAPDGPGPMRVDYILPDATLRVVGSGTVLPGTADGGAPDPVRDASRHRLVWVDIALP